ncbi:MAG: DsbA family protein [Anaerolineae bacterium]|nr:DsbA family protein [Anaerolineae bacterium]NUQ07348.1 thioredoxin domain-containing protein [Anaerolineae bacterium]
MTRSLTRPLVLFSALILLLVGVGSAGAQDEEFRALLATLPFARTEDGAFIIGDPQAPITIIEFSDYACPHCMNYRETINQFIAEYVSTGQARFELRVFPTAGGRRTVYAARVAECAGRLHEGGFWHASEMLYDLAGSGGYNAPLGRVVADDLGIDYLAMLGCIWRARQIVTDYNFATALGIGGTPAVVVRYGDGEAAFIEYEGLTYSGGPVALDILAAVVEAANE